MRALVTLGVGLLMTGACAAKRLPPGTPPPEYEIRQPEPWVDPEDAGTAPSEDAAVPPDAGAPSLPPSEIVPDAGQAVEGPSPDAGKR